jgi:hypothetical protein
MADNPAAWGAVAADEGPSAWGAVEASNSQPEKKKKYVIRTGVNPVIDAISDVGLGARTVYGDQIVTKQRVAAGDEAKKDDIVDLSEMGVPFKGRKIGAAWKGAPVSYEVEATPSEWKAAFAKEGEELKDRELDPGEVSRVISMRAAGSLPAQAAGIAAAGASLRATSKLPIPGLPGAVVKGGLALGAGLLGSTLAQKPVEKTLESLAPEFAQKLEEDRILNPGLTETGEIISGFATGGPGGFKESLKRQLVDRGVGAGSQAGLATYGEMKNAEEGELLAEGGLGRILRGAAVGGLLQNKNTRLGDRYSEMGIDVAESVANKLKGGRITSKLGSVKGGDPLPKVQQSVDSILNPGPGEVSAGEFAKYPAPEPVQLGDFDTAKQERLNGQAKVELGGEPVDLAAFEAELVNAEKRRQVAALKNEIEVAAANRKANVARPIPEPNPAEEGLLGHILKSSSPSTRAEINQVLTEYYTKGAEVPASGDPLVSPALGASDANLANDTLLAGAMKEAARKAEAEMIRSEALNDVEEYSTTHLEDLNSTDIGKTTPDKYFGQNPRSTLLSDILAAEARNANSGVERNVALPGSPVAEIAQSAKGTLQGEVVGSDVLTPELAAEYIKAKQAPAKPNRVLKSLSELDPSTDASATPRIEQPKTSVRPIKEAANVMPDFEVITGEYHEAIRQKARELGYSEADILKSKEGFVTQEGNWVSREEAAKLLKSGKRTMTAERMKMEELKSKRGNDPAGLGQLNSGIDPVQMYQGVSRAAKAVKGAYNEFMGPLGIQRPGFDGEPVKTQGKPVPEADTRPLSERVLPESTPEGVVIPENIAHNNKVFQEYQSTKSAEVGLPPPNPEDVDASSDGPAQYKPFLSDLTGRFPVLEKTWPTRVLANGISNVASAAKRGLGTISDNIGDVSKRVKGVITLRDQRAGQIANEYMDATTGKNSFWDLAKTKLSKEDYRELPGLTLTDDAPALIEFLSSKEGGQELIAAYRKNQSIKAEARQRLVDLGVDMGEIESYFRRVIKDRRGLAAYMKKAEPGLWNDAMAAARKRKGAALSMAEEAEVLNQVLSNRRNISAVSSSKKSRTIDKIDREMAKFYEHPAVTDGQWAVHTASEIANREMFGMGDYDGKTDLTKSGGSLGRVIAEEVAAGRIQKEGKGLEIINDNIRDLFKGYKKENERVASLWASLRRFQTAAYLADVGPAITQLSDIFSIFRAYGFEGLKGAIASRKGPKISDIGVSEGHNVDAADFRVDASEGDGLLSGAAGKAANTLSKYPGWVMKNTMGRVDTIMKNATVRAGIAKVAAEANSGSRWFKRVEADYSAMFPERWPEMKKSLQSKDFAQGKLDENSALFLFAEMSKLQPISASQRAQNYNASGEMGKMLYVLRSYWIKQLGILRNEVYNEMKNGRVGRGSANLLSYLAFVTIGQQTVSYLKDKMLNRDVDEVEYAAAGAMQLAGVPRSFITRGKRIGWMTGLAELAVPGTGLGNDLLGDITQVVPKWYSGSRDAKGDVKIPDAFSMAQNLESTKYFPGGGDLFYSYFGKGALSGKKEQERLMKTGERRRTTLQELGDLIVPPNDKQR